MNLGWAGVSFVDWPFLQSQGDKLFIKEDNICNKAETGLV